MSADLLPSCSHNNPELEDYNFNASLICPELFFFVITVKDRRRRPEGVNEG
jgi:hypothetical protein